MATVNNWLRRYWFYGVPVAGVLIISMIFTSAPEQNTQKPVAQPSPSQKPLTSRDNEQTMSDKSDKPLVATVIRFEKAYFSRAPGSSGSQKREQLRRYASREFMDWYGEEEISSAEQSLDKRKITLSVAVQPSDITGEVLDSKTAIISTNVLLMQSKNGSIISRVRILHTTYWAYQGGNWRIFPPPDPTKGGDVNATSSASRSSSNTSD